LHIKFDPSNVPNDATIMIVEGSLKADALSALRPKLYVAATAGVSTTHAALIDLTRGRRAMIGFDQDYHYNEAV
jgi:hypothetical protein